MGRRSTRPIPWTPRPGEASIDAGIEAKEADVAAISWAVPGLATGAAGELVHEDELTRRRRVGTFALAADGVLLGGMLGAAFGLGSLSLIRFAAGTAAPTPLAHGAGRPPRVGRLDGLARLHDRRPARQLVRRKDGAGGGVQSPPAGAALLRRLRLAWFVEVRPMDDRDELVAVAAELEETDVARLATDFAGATSLHALHTDTALARRPDRVALALGTTAQPPGEPGPRFTNPEPCLRSARTDCDAARVPAACDL
jgi:hypothetical protein